MKIRDIITEGGWASTQTQETKITPALVKHMVGVYNKFIMAFNQFLKIKDVPLVEPGHPVGSSFYYQRDLVDNPEKEYGDIDIQFRVPRISGMSEAANEAMYSVLVKEFLESNRTATTNNGVNVIFQVGNDYVQIDLVSIFGDRVDWARALVPERGIKGVVGASLYSALAEVLNLSISSRGIQIKLRDGQPVSFRQSKNVSLDSVSTSAEGWAVDILNYFYHLQARNGTALVGPALKANPGTNPDEIKISDIAAAVRALGKSFELNKMWGGTGLLTINSYDEYMDKIRTVYKYKLTDKLSDPKFDKATTPAQLDKAASDKHKIQTGLDMVMGYLK